MLPAAKPECHSTTETKQQAGKAPPVTHIVLPAWSQYIGPQALRSAHLFVKVTRKKLVDTAAHPQATRDRDAECHLARCRSQ